MWFSNSDSIFSGRSTNLIFPDSSKMITATVNVAVKTDRNIKNDFITLIGTPFLE